MSVLSHAISYPVVVNVTPSVIEPSFGIGRILYAVLEHNYRVREDDEKRNWLSVPSCLAPIGCSVLPLSSNPQFGTYISTIGKKEALSLYMCCNLLTWRDLVRYLFQPLLTLDNELFLATTSRLIAGNGKYLYGLYDYVYHTSCIGTISHIMFSQLSSTNKNKTQT